MTQPCIQEEKIGRMQEFMDTTKGFRVLMYSMLGTIILQIVMFAYLWGEQASTVTKNTKYLWENVTPLLLENTRNIDKILERMTVIKMIGIMGEKGEKGEKGDMGVQGIQGKDGELHGSR